MSPNYSILEEVIEVGGHAFSLREIGQMAQDEKFLAGYEINYPNELYSLILLSLTHRAYKETEARELWSNILIHKESLNSALNREVGISVATLDYLTNIKGSLDEPKIIEDSKSKIVTKLATIDDLTQLYVREVFDVTLNKEIEIAKRNQQHLSLALIDIDDFKLVNDQYGHLAGDDVLSKIGQCINESIREMDLSARYGGEELAIIMPNTKIENAKEICERVRRNVKALQFECGAKVSISIGLSVYNDEDKNLEQLINDADSALYRAKERGKNNVFLTV